MIEWVTGFHLNGFTVPYAGGFLWTFVKGDYWSGDPRVVLHRDRRAGRWDALEDAPIIAAANADVVVGVEAVATDEMRFLLFRKRE